MESPTFIYPVAVTPDELSSEEEEDEVANNNTIVPAESVRKPPNVSENRMKPISDLIDVN